MHKRTPSRITAKDIHNNTIQLQVSSHSYKPPSIFRQDLHQQPTRYTIPLHPTKTRSSTPPPPWPFLILPLPRPALTPSNPARSAWERTLAAVWVLQARSLARSQDT